MTGGIPAALAGLLPGMKVPGVQMIASVTFIAIPMTIMIQAPTTEWLGRRLGLMETGWLWMKLRLCARPGARRTSPLLEPKLTSLLRGKTSAFEPTSASDAFLDSGIL